ncbi:phage tail assembly chaperone G [Clostridium sp.]|uniref:phage tail assembly chaperone G n=1 Tax=Clostridium sp. TaxID=1506 RepID=UPI00399332F8
MKLKLEIEQNGEFIEKEFSTPRMRGRALKRMLEVTDVLTKAQEEGLFTLEHQELMCEFICEMFGNKFTSEELLDGIELSDLYPTFMTLTETIGKKTMLKMENLLKN